MGKYFIKSAQESKYSGGTPFKTSDIVQSYFGQDPDLVLKPDNISIEPTVIPSTATVTKVPDQAKPTIKINPNTVTLNTKLEEIPEELRATFMRGLFEHETSLRGVLSNLTDGLSGNGLPKGILANNPGNILIRKKIFDNPSSLTDVFNTIKKGYPNSKFLSEAPSYDPNFPFEHIGSDKERYGMVLFPSLGSGMTAAQKVFFGYNPKLTLEQAMRIYNGTYDKSPGYGPGIIDKYNKYIIKSNIIDETNQFYNNFRQYRFINNKLQKI